MRIHYCSDIHLEMGDLKRPFPTGDVLVLAGDITTLGCLDSQRPGHLLSYGLRQRTRKFFEDVSANFNRVFYLMGNHEAYHYHIDQAADTIRRELPMVEFLDDRAVELADGIILVGGTLWTDMDGDNPVAHIRVGRGMNDFRMIAAGPNNARFSTHDAVARHHKTMAVIRAAAQGNPGKTVVVATHHAPSFKGVNPAHAGSVMNPGYASSLDSFIMSQPNIRHGIFGHTHLQTAFKIGQCDVVSNAKGYPHESSAATFSMDRSFEVFAPLELRTAKVRI